MLKFVQFAKIVIILYHQNKYKYIMNTSKISIGDKIIASYLNVYYIGYVTNVVTDTTYKTQSYVISNAVVFDTLSPIQLPIGHIVESSDIINVIKLY